MMEKSINSRDKLTLTNANFHSMDLNRSLSNSYMTSSYIRVKNGSKKKKRHANSYMEEFLEKRRMAAEFAQSKRSISSKNNRTKLTEDEKNNKDTEYDISMNIKKMDETININNLKNNLPGKTKELINNTNNLNKYITSSNKTNSISRQENYTIGHNKYNNFKRHNIVYTKKTNLSQNTGKNNTNITSITNLSNHSYTENRYNTHHDNDNDNENEEQCNIIHTNDNDNKNENENIRDINKINDISPIEQNHIILNAKGGIDITNENKIINEKKEKEKINNKELNNSEHFLSIMERMIKNVDMNMNKSQPSYNNIPEKDSNNFNKIALSQNNNDFHKYKEFEKFLNKTEKKILDLNKEYKNEDSNEEEHLINKDNNIENKEGEFFITNTNIKESSEINMDNSKEDKEKDLQINNENDIVNKEQNNNQKISEEYIVEENEEKNLNMAYEKEEENDIEEIEQEKSVNRQEEQEEENEEENNMSNNNEEEEENEDVERCEVLKGDGDKSKYLKGKNNIITEEILEVEEGTEINENTGEFPTIKSGRNKNSTRNKNESNELVLNKLNKEIDKDEDKNNNSEQKEEKKYNNLNKIEIKDLKKNKIINEKSNINRNYNFVYSNHINNDKNDNILENIEYIEYNNTSNYNEHNNILNISKSNKKEEEKVSDNNEDFNLNKLSDIKNINSEFNEMVETPDETNYENNERNYKEREDFFKVINRDIERLEKIRNSNNINVKDDESYLYEIDNFINLIREKRKSVNNNNILLNDINDINKKDYIPPKNILELKKIYKNLNKNNLNINTDSNYNNINNNIILNRINYSKMKLPISKSSSLQSLLNEIKKDKTYNININNININNDNKIINNNFFTEKINKEINDSINNNISKESEENPKNDFKLFDETKFRKIKETNLRKRNKFRNEFKFKDFQTNKNMSHMYLDKVKEDLLMNFSEIKYVNNEAKNKWNMKKLSYLNNTEIDIDNSEIMPANNMKSLYFNKL